MALRVFLACVVLLVFLKNIPAWKSCGGGGGLNF
jgi:hypothetical protein